MKANIRAMQKVISVFEDLLKSEKFDLLDEILEDYALEKSEAVQDLSKNEYKEVILCALLTTVPAKAKLKKRGVLLKKLSEVIKDAPDHDKVMKILT